MGEMGRCDVDCVDLVEKISKFLAGFDAFKFLGECVAFLKISVVGGNDVYSVDDLRFRWKSLCYASATDDADIHDALRFLAQHRRGDALGTGKIDDFAEFVQIVKQSGRQGPSLLRLQLFQEHCCEHSAFLVLCQNYRL